MIRLTLQKGFNFIHISSIVNDFDKSRNVRRQQYILVTVGP
jgi:hypothetical protein